MPEESPVAASTVRACQSIAAVDDWAACLAGARPLSLPAGSSHTVDVQTDVHSTAFLWWTFKAPGGQSQIRLKAAYSEGYELDPRDYPYFRTKGDRLDAEKGYHLGPYDEVTLELSRGQTIVYEPFWFRTFRILRLEVTVGPEPVELLSFDATQVNYPMAVKAGWREPGDEHSEKIWDVSIRTMRNCMFDGYSDCPFYEQLQ